MLQHCLAVDQIATTFWILLVIGSTCLKLKRHQPAMCSAQPKVWPSSWGDFTKIFENVHLMNKCRLQFDVVHFGGDMDMHSSDPQGCKSELRQAAWETFVIHSHIIVIHIWNLDGSSSVPAPRIASFLKHSGPKRRCVEHLSGERKDDMTSGSGQEAFLSL